MSDKELMLYSLQQLPDGFRYPQAFVDMVMSGSLPEIYPWWFIDASTETGKGLFSRRQRDGRNLIPFAKVDADLNDIACFDGDDTSGNPAVLMLVLDESGRNYSFKDFEEWLAFAKAYAEGIENFLGSSGFNC